MNKEIELLNNKLDAQDKIINNQALEIARLKEDYRIYEDKNNYISILEKGLNTAEENCLKLQQKIDKAIDYIVKNCILSNEWTDLDFCNFIPTGKITYKQLTSKKVKNLLEILGDKENE